MLKTHIPKIVLSVRFIILFSLFIKNNEIQNTNAIFDMLEPTAFPIANIVSFFSADSIEINISGAEVDIPIRKKLATKPEIEYFEEKLSVEFTRNEDPKSNSISPVASINIASSIINKIYAIVFNS